MASSVHPRTAPAHACGIGATDDDERPAAIESDVPDAGRRTSWAELLRRTFKVDVLRCPACGGRRKVIAMITQADVIRKILGAMGLPTEPPAIDRDRSPPPGYLDLCVDGAPAPENPDFTH